jgi:hypothetical protein
MRLFVRPLALPQDGEEGHGALEVHKERELFLGTTPQSTLPVGASLTLLDAVLSAGRHRMWDGSSERVLLTRPNNMGGGWVRT